MELTEKLNKGGQKWKVAFWFDHNSVKDAELSLPEKIEKKNKELNFSVDDNSLISFIFIFFPFWLFFL